MLRVELKCFSGPVKHQLNLEFFTKPAKIKCMIKFSTVPGLFKTFYAIQIGQFVVLMIVRFSKHKDCWRDHNL